MLKTVDYITVDGTAGSIAPAKIHRIERERSLMDTATNQHVIDERGRQNNALMNAIVNGTRSFKLVWITVIYTNAGRNQIRVMDEFKTIQEKMDITLSSYHS